MERARSALTVLIMILFFVFLGTKKSAQYNIKKIGLNSRYYPKRYALLPRWIRKSFGIEQRMVPRFLYFELLLAMVFFVYAFVLAVYTLIASDPFNGWLILIPVLLSVLDIFLSSILTSVYLRSGKEKK